MFRNIKWDYLVADVLHITACSIFIVVMVRIRTDPDGSGMGLEVLKTSTNGYADVRVVHAIPRQQNLRRRTNSTVSNTANRRQCWSTRNRRDQAFVSSSSIQTWLIVGYDNRSSFDRTARYTPDRRSYRTSDDGATHSPAKGGEISRYESNYKRPRC